MCYHYSLTKIALRSENRFSAFQSDYKIIEEYDDMYHVNGFKFPEMPVVASDAPDRFQMGKGRNKIQGANAQRTF